MMTVHCYLFVYQQGCQIMLFRNSYVTENKHRDKHNDISESLSHHLKHLFPHCKLMLLNKCVDCHFLNIRGRKVFCDAWKSEAYTIVSVDMLLKYHYFRTSQYSQVTFLLYEKQFPLFTSACNQSNMRRTKRGTNITKSVLKR